ncbi:hypothetical protein CLOM_g22140 [Closterium sp. NIES-68]|nr:hypothetical protein CLOM_g22140 [Closterium sp. NIES-68]GJP74494.1 hypothetical protein CLOP_g5064 [Closterium sp. NIES-67]
MLLAALLMCHLEPSSGLFFQFFRRKKPKKVHLPPYKFGANPATAPLDPAHQNDHRFRFASMGFSLALSLWQLPAGKDWSQDSRVASLRGVVDQGNCASSWAVAAAQSVEMAYAIQNPSSSSIANVSVQQLVDCAGVATACTAGGWPSLALNYMADATDDDGGVVAEADYEYTGAQGTCDDSKVSGDASSIGVAALEQADFQGWLGLVLAVQAQPVVAFVHGSHPSFLTYKTGVYADGACAGEIVDHSVLVVGFKLAMPRPYFIIRNSWGTKWGMQGYMRMAIAGGPGICGINTVPPVYPVIKTSSPCSATINPCGSGTCNAGSGGSYTCSCPLTFVSVTGLSSMPTCVPKKQCSLGQMNPCGSGTCIDDNTGSYFCICPPLFTTGDRADGSPTCVPDPTPSGAVYFTPPKSVSCDLVYGINGLSKAQFLTLNPSQRNNIIPSLCDPIPANTQVEVTRPASGVVQCALFYSWEALDTCVGVTVFFGISLVAFVNLNPGVDCVANYPQASQQVCVQQGTPSVTKWCTQWHTVGDGDTCQRIVKQYKSSSLSLRLLYALNPGLRCKHLFPLTSLLPGASMKNVGQQLCVGGASPASYTTATPASFAPARMTREEHLPLDHSPLPSSSLAARPVSSRRQLAASCVKAYTVVRGDTCARIISLYFQNSARKLSDLNDGYVCTNDRLYVGLRLCTQR